MSGATALAVNAPAANAVTDTDLELLRDALEQARITRAAGNRPYGAVIADARGRFIAAAGNTAAESRDCTAHAEVNAIRAAFRRVGREGLASATLYASAEPCVMCAGAIYWSGVRRVVYGAGLGVLSGTATSTGAAMPQLGCREVLAALDARIEVLGPLLEAESAALFDA